MLACLVVRGGEKGQKGFLRLLLTSSKVILLALDTSNTEQNAPNPIIERGRPEYDEKRLVKTKRKENCVRACAYSRTFSPRS